MGRAATGVFVLVCAAVAPAQQHRSSSEFEAALAPLDRPGEVVELRDAHSRTYDNGDGTRTTVLYPSPIHYRAADGSWQPIDLDLRADGEIANLTSTVRARFAPDGAYAWIGLDDARHYVWTPQSIGYRRDGAYTAIADAELSDGAIDGNILRYPGLFGGAADRWEIQPAMIKHDVILDAPPAIPADAQWFEVVGRVTLAEGLAFETEAPFDTTGSVWIVQGAERVMRFSPAFAQQVDARLGAAGSWVVTPLGGQEYEVRVRISAAWLLDPDRAYPVRIDPTTWSADGVKVDNSYDYDGAACLDSGIAWSSWGNVETGLNWADPGWSGNNWYDCTVGADGDG